MLFEGMLLSLAQNVCALVLHLSARGSFPQPLEAQEESELVRRMIDEGDAAARNELIEHNLRLVAHIAKKYARAGDAEDLVSIGSIGLIKAVHTFKPEAGRLTTYASRCIENEIRMYLRACKKLRNTTTMTDAVTRDKDGNEVQITDLMGTDRDMVPDEVALRIDGGRARRLIGEVLDDREARVIRLRYGLEDGALHAQHEVAALLGISRSYVSRIEKRALEKLREHME